MRFEIIACLFVLVAAHIYEADGIIISSGCKPNSSFKIACNTCRCGSNGEVQSCTRKRCSSEENDNDDDPEIPNTQHDKKYAQFEQFIVEYEREYRNLDEYKRRFGLFKNTLAMIDRVNNDKDSTWKAGINDFADWTPKEVSKISNGIL